MVWFKKLIARYDVVTMLRWVYCLAALMVLPFGARELVHTDFAAMDTDILLATLFVVFVPTYVPNLLLNYSLKYVQPTVSSIYTYLQPVLAVVLSVAMGLDRLHLDTALCALVIFFGVGLVIRSYRGPAVPSAPLPSIRIDFLRKKGRKFADCRFLPIFALPVCARCARSVLLLTI